MADQAASTRDVVPGFAGMVRKAREEKGMTVAQLAEAVGSSPSAISRIETENRSPSLRMAIALAEGLELSLDDLMRDLKKSRKKK